MKILAHVLLPVCLALLGCGQDATPTTAEADVEESHRALGELVTCRGTSPIFSWRSENTYAPGSQPVRYHYRVYRNEQLHDYGVLTFASATVAELYSEKLLRVAGTMVQSTGSTLDWTFYDAVNTWFSTPFRCDVAFQTTAAGPEEVEHRLTDTGEVIARHLSHLYFPAALHDGHRRCRVCELTGNTQEGGSFVCTCGESGSIYCESGSWDRDQNAISSVTTGQCPGHERYIH